MKSLLLGHKQTIKNYKPYVIMIFIQCINAGLALMSKASISKGMNPHVFVFYSRAFASLALAPFAFLDRKQATPLSFNLICKIFLISLCGLTAFSNLYYVALKNTSATFAAASINTVPVITFFLAVTLRVESVSIKHKHGLAKILGSILCLSGAMTFAFVNGPPLNFMKCHPENQRNISQSSTAVAKGNHVKGSLLMLSANSFFSLWLILQGFIVKQYPAKFRLNALQCLFSCMQSSIVAVIVERNPSAWKLGWDFNLLSVAYCAIFVNVIGFWLRVCVIEEKGPVFSSMFNPLAIIITAIFSAFFWKEILHWGSVGGTILLVVGLYSVLWGKHKESTTAAAQKITNEDLRKQEIKEETKLECLTQKSNDERTNMHY